MRFVRGTMPHSLSAGLITSLTATSTTLNKLVSVVRTDGYTIGFTDYDLPIVYSGITYQPTDAGAVSSFTQSIGSGIDTADFAGLMTAARVTESDLRYGLYDNASVAVYLINPNSVSDGAYTLGKGYIGEVRYGNGAFTAESRGLTQVLRQTVGEVISRTCRCGSVYDVRCGVTKATYTFNRTVSAINSSATAVASAAVQQVNCGGGASGSWVADTGYTGGSTNSTGHAITTTGVVNPAPTAVYQTWRTVGTIQYSLGGYNAGQAYTVRLHFSENIWSSSGQRQFDIYDGALQTIAYQYDIYNAAGAQYQAAVLSFDTTANASGNIVVTIRDATSDQTLVCGVEIFKKATPAISGGFTLGSDTHPSGYYTGGILLWSTGSNAGRTYEIESHVNVSGAAVLTLRQEMQYPVQVGDTCAVSAGCDYKFPTCAFKFANAARFRAEPHLPGNNAIIQVGRSR